MKKTLLVVLLLTSAFCFALERQPNNEYRARRVALSEKAGPFGVFLVFAGVESEGPNALYGFRQDENFYYLTGISEPGGVVMIAPAREAKDDQPARTYTEILFLPARKPVQEKWTGVKPGPDDPNIRQTTGFDRVVALDRMRDELVKVLPQRGYVNVLVNESPEADATKQWLERYKFVSWLRSLRRWLRQDC